jgi:hypothetical protein
MNATQLFHNDGRAYGFSPKKSTVKEALGERWDYQELCLGKWVSRE